MLVARPHGQISLYSRDSLSVFLPRSITHHCFHCVAQVNATEEDRTKAPSLLSRSVGLLRMELAEGQIASTDKLRNEFQKRSNDNSTACDVLYNHQDVWASVGGPPAESLFRPSELDIKLAKECCTTLQKLSEGDDPDGLSDC